MGYGLLDVSRSAISCAGYGVLKAPASAPIEQRLAFLYRDLLEVLRVWRPHAMAVEEPFLPRSSDGGNGYRTSARSAIAVGQAQAVALLAAAKHGIPVTRYAPAQVKRAVSQEGRSSKEQVQEMVKLLLGLAERPEPDDAADALAVAICHAQSLQTSRLLALDAPTRVRAARA
ncbi:MAG: crossover junction endodeoxyribonuclease RuvC [Dehalococcoidia bacterium]|nr:crossover junction endodeoxyribonuclease RuvC [Dehalococcoidia bacterium]